MPQAELLDTALVLLRRRALPLFLLAVPLLAIEQLLLWYAGSPLLDTYAGFDEWWPVLAALFAGDVAAVAVLGAYAGAAAVPALLGQEVSHRALFRRMRPLPLLVTTLLFFAAAWSGAYFGFVAWIACYGFFGLAGVALALDRSGWPFGAYGRSAAVAARLGWRGFWGRMRAFALWSGIRVALAAGPIAFLWQFGFVAPGYVGDWPVLLMWGLAGAVSCAALACFDAVLVIDTRIRTEGLDIVLRRAVANGLDPAEALVHTRPRNTPAPVLPHAPVLLPPPPPPPPPGLLRPSAPSGRES